MHRWFALQFSKKNILPQSFCLHLRNDFHILKIVLLRAYGNFEKNPQNPPRRDGHRQFFPGSDSPYSMVRQLGSDRFPTSIVREIYTRSQCAGYGVVYTIHWIYSHVSDLHRMGRRQCLI